MDMIVGKPEPYARGKDFDDWDFYVQWIRWYNRSGLSNSAANIETVADSGDSNVTTRAAIRDAAVPSFDAHAERSTQDREESWKQTVSKLTDRCA